MIKICRIGIEKVVANVPKTSKIEVKIPKI